MLVQGETYIYLADRRHGLRTETYRSLSSFEQPLFGKLLAFHDDTFLPGAVAQVCSDKPVEMILIPMVGGLELNDGHGESVFISPGESFRLLVFPESQLSLVNPYEADTVRFLKIICAAGDRDFFSDHFGPEPCVEFPLHAQDQLHIGFQSTLGNVTGRIGQYRLRSQDEYVPNNSAAGLFIYVIQGAFEVQNRLLETGDGLSLPGNETLEFEALSEGALILVVEVG